MIKLEEDKSVGIRYLATF